MTKITRTVKNVRSPFGKLVKWLFIGFNLLMAFWLFNYWGDVAPMMKNGSGAEQAGAAIGSTLGTGLIMMTWLVGTVILGIPVLLTKGKLIEIEETASISQPLSPTNETSIPLAENQYSEIFSEPVAKASSELPKSKIIEIVKYVAAILFMLSGLGSMISASLLGGAIMVLAGSLFLPQIHKHIQNTPFKSPVALGCAILCLFFLSSYFNTTTVEKNNTEIEEKNAITAQKTEVELLAKQQDSKKDAEAKFLKDPNNILQEISTYAENKNWSLVKEKTELLLDTGNAEIKKLHNEAIAKIAENEKEAARLIAQQQKTNQEAQLASTWYVSRDHSKMDDTPSITVSKNSKDSIEAWLKQVTPTLIIRCQEKSTDVIFNIGTSFTPVYGEYNKAKIRIRIDDKKPLAQYWSESTDNDAAFAPNAINLLRQMKGAERLRVEFNPFNANPATAEFDIRGLKTHLEEVAKTCKWKL